MGPPKAKMRLTRSRCSMQPRPKRVAAVAAAAAIWETSNPTEFQLQQQQQQQRRNDRKKSNSVTKPSCRSPSNTKERSSDDKKTKSSADTESTASESKSDLESNTNKEEQTEKTTSSTSLKRPRNVSIATKNEKHPASKKRSPPRPRPLNRRSSSRGQEASLAELASMIVQGKNVVIISGAGLSVDSGIRPFRTNPVKTGDVTKKKLGKHFLQEGLWNDVIWTTATRESFRKDPVRWYNDFWIPHFCVGGPYFPNVGHTVLQEIMEMYPQTVKQITQNIDGLQKEGDKPDEKRQLIEVHGRCGLFKCCPREEEESDADSESDDDDEERLVHLGHRRTVRKKRKAVSDPKKCPYQFLESLPADQVEFKLEPLSEDKKSGSEQDQVGSSSIQENAKNEVCGTQGVVTSSESAIIKEAPSCPVCGNDVMPQALLFDEGYHSHLFYSSELAEDWLIHADCLVFVGTSFAVRLTQVALEHARDNHLPVFNFNLQHDVLESTIRLNACNIVGPVSETLPRLGREVREQRQKITESVYRDLATTVLKKFTQQKQREEALEKASVSTSEGSQNISS